MHTATTFEPRVRRPNPLGIVAPAKSPRRISWATFQQEYLEREDGFTYEWSHGTVEKTRTSMDSTQLFIQKNLTRLFYRLLAQGAVEGDLLAEPDIFLMPEVHKRPDFAWLTDEQVKRLAKKGAVEVPAFVIEVVSGNDVAQKLATKMKVYRNAGVQVVWQIYPNEKEVHVYAGAGLEQSQVCFGEKICSASPALPNFEFPVSEVFKNS